MALPGITDVRAAHREAIAAVQAAELDLLHTIQRIAAGHTPGTRSGRLSDEERNELLVATLLLTNTEHRAHLLAERVAFMEET